MAPCKVRIDLLLVDERKGSMVSKLFILVLKRPGSFADDLSLGTGLSVQTANQAVKRLVAAEIFRNVEIKAYPLSDLTL